MLATRHPLGPDTAYEAHVRSVLGLLADADEMLLPAVLCVRHAGHCAPDLTSVRVTGDVVAGD
jgi:hypothetical protein